MDKKLANKIFAHIDSRELVAFVQTLVCTNSENPPGNEKATALLLADLLDSFGCQVQLQEVEPDRPNVIGILAGECREKILFNGHTDTVKVGNLDAWSVEPLGGEIKGRFLGGAPVI